VCAVSADDVEVSGVVIHLWGRDVPGARCDCRLAVYALHAQVVSLQKAAIQVHGLDVIMSCWTWRACYSRGLKLRAVVKAVLRASSA